MRHSGQSMTEYGLVAALIAVVAIPALVLLSDNVGDSMANILSARPSGQNAGNGPGQNGGNPSSGQQTVQSGQQTIQYNPTTGQFTIPLPEASGGGTATASVDGVTELLANQLRLIADRYQAENAPPDITNYLYLMARHAQELADQQEHGIQASGNVNYVQMGQSGAAYGDVYKDWLNSVGSKVNDGTYRQYQEVFDLVNIYTNVISSVTDDLYVNDPTAKNVVDIVKGETGYQYFASLGTMDMTGTSQETGQGMTEESADGLDELSGG